MKRKTTILFILLITITATFISTSIITQGNTAPLSEAELSTNILAFGEYAPDWSLKEVRSDQTRSMSYYRGKAVLLDFFATWCDPCTNQFLPYLKAVRQHYTSAQLTIISIDTDPSHDNETTVEQYIEDYGITWDVFRDTSTVSDDYEVNTIPTFYIVDKNQIVHLGHTGVVSDDYLITKLDEIIETPRDPSEWWINNWYWFAIGIIVVVIVSVAIIQRRRVILHNRKVDEHTIESNRRKRRKRSR
ncbi:MAG: TlpA family protein disulfide reductase [Candidatus Heimdallarchaeota archaeon]